MSISSLARFRSRGMALRPVHRIKHVVDSSATLAAATQLEVNLITSVDAPVLANTTECETGSKVNGIYLKIIVASNEATVAGAIPNVYLAIWKDLGGVQTAPNPQTVGDDVNKRQVIHQEMTMVQNQISSNASVLFNGVIKIPKGFIRNGPGDKLVAVIKCPQIAITFCVQCHYKEFR